MTISNENLMITAMSCVYFKVWLSFVKVISQHSQKTHVNMNTCTSVHMCTQIHTHDKNFLEIYPWSNSALFFFFSVVVVRTLRIEFKILFMMGRWTSSELYDSHCFLKPVYQHVHSGMQLMVLPCFMGAVTKGTHPYPWLSRTSKQLLRAC